MAELEIHREDTCTGKNWKRNVMNMNFNSIVSRTINLQYINEMTFSSLTSLFVMKLITIYCISNLYYLLDKIIKLFKHLIYYLSRFMLRITRVGLYNHCRLQTQLIYSLKNWRTNRI